MIPFVIKFARISPVCHPRAFSNKPIHDHPITCNLQIPPKPETIQVAKPAYYSKEAIINTLYSIKEDIKSTRYIADLNEVITNVKNEMERKKMNIMKVKITICILILIVVLALYDLITSWLGGQVGAITEKSLDDEELKRKLVITCKETLKELVQSDDVTGLLKMVVVELTEREEIREEIREKVKELLKVVVANLADDDETKDKVTELLKKCVVGLSNDQEVEKELRDLLMDLVKSTSNDPDVQKQASVLVSNALYGAFFGR